MARCGRGGAGNGGGMCEIKTLGNLEGGGEDIQHHWQLGRVWRGHEDPREDFSGFMVGMGGLMGGPSKPGVWWLAWCFAVDK